MAARSKVNRHRLGNSVIQLVGNSDLNQAISYLDIVSPLSGGAYTNFDIDSDSFSASLWVKLFHTGISTDYNYSVSILSQTDNNGGFASVSGPGTGRGLLSSNVSTGQFSCNLGNVSRLSGFVPQPNIWYFVNLIRDKAAGTLGYYVNGQAYNQFTGVVSFESCTGKIHIGANRGIVRSMDGYVYKPRFAAGVAYTQAQIQALYLNDIITGTKEYELLCGEKSLPFADTGAHTYAVDVHNGAGIALNQSPFLARTKVSRSKVARTKVI